MPDIYLPTGLIISNLTITHNTPVYYNESLSLIGSSKDRNIHRLEGSFDVTVSGDSDTKKLEAFLLRVRGRGKPFKLQLGKRFTSTTVIPSPIITLEFNEAVGSNILRASAGTFSGSISAGDMFNIAGDTKIYTVLDDVANTTENFEIFPPVRTLAPENTALEFINPTILVRLDGDTQTLSYDEGGLITTMTFDWIESL